MSEPDAIVSKPPVFAIWYCTRTSCPLPSPMSAPADGWNPIPRTPVLLLLNQMNPLIWYQPVHTATSCPPEECIPHGSVSVQLVFDANDVHALLGNAAVSVSRRADIIFVW